MSHVSTVSISITLHLMQSLQHLPYPSKITPIPPVPDIPVSFGDLPVLNVPPPVIPTTPPLRLYEPEVYRVDLASTSIRVRRTLVTLQLRPSRFSLHYQHSMVYYCGEVIL